MKDLKKLITSGEQVVGGAIMYGEGKEHIEKLLDYYDYDFISVDGQHSPTNEDYLLKVCEAAYELDKPVHYRIDHRRHAYMIGNLLDHGPTIIEVPQTEEVYQAQEARDNFYYRPKGIRSFGGAGRPPEGLKEVNQHTYPEWWNNTGVLMIQIETLNAINNIPNFSLDGVDCFSWGPADLSIDRKFHPEHPFAKTDDEAIKHAVKLSKDNGKQLCIRSQDKTLRNRYFDMGATILIEKKISEGKLNKNLPFG
jgi:2-keto-3-deoxy-L-rhamnonate aldolase RhmA